MLVFDIPIILTNLVCLISVIYALKTNRFIQAIFISFSGIISLIYHFLWSIQTEDENLKIIRYYHTFLDYYHETLALISVMVSLYKLNDLKKETILTIFLSCIFLGLNLILSIFEPLNKQNIVYDVINIDNKIVIIIVTFIICFIGCITKFIICKEFPNYNLIYFNLSIISLILGLSNFIYGYLIFPYYIHHSLWHTLIFITPYLLFKSIDNPHIYSNILLNIKKIIIKLKLLLFKIICRKKKEILQIVEKKQNEINIDIDIKQERKEVIEEIELDTNNIKYESLGDISKTPNNIGVSYEKEIIDNLNNNNYYIKIDEADINKKIHKKHNRSVSTYN
jgi:lysylphosphatidylglycerol synthetase-like protein (DUF2156 family)